MSKVCKECGMAEEHSSTCVVASERDFIDEIGRLQSALRELLVATQRPHHGSSQISCIFCGARFDQYVNPESRGKCDKWCPAAKAREALELQ